MQTKLKVADVLGKPGQTAKGFIQQFTVIDILGGKSVVKLFSKELSGLPTKTGEEVTVDCNEFCFVAK